MNTKKLVLDNVRVFSTERMDLVENGRILVEGGRISSAGSRGSVDIPPDAQVIDGGGRVALPGLIDAHLHITGMRSGDNVKEPLLTPMGVFFARGVKDLEKLIMAGFTTIVDAGGIVALHLREAVNEGTIIGPRVFAAGFSLSPTFGHGDVHYMPVEYVDARTSKFMKPLKGLICDGEAECRKAARYSMREGADFIKVMATGGVLSQRDRPEYRQFTLEELKVIVDEARAAKRFVHAHAQGKEGIMNALNAGVKVIAHAIYMDEEAALLAKEKDAVVVPTLSIVHKILEVGNKAGIPEWGLRKSEEVYRDHVENARKAKKLGVKLATGTDFLGGFFPHGENAMELKIFVEKLGMTPGEAIRAATETAAEVAGMKGQTGKIEAGMVADIILVKENPLMSIDSLLKTENIELVMKGGEIVKNKLPQ
ncbi:MAG TPA: amidohydrolase family protein [Fervidicoccus fontis]|jgi:imidazolonepropionase-like amidohydrolase|uniref:Amidohydrolase family protein n=1 Tax=Fervidicoccus fontis TaxID=683846 RepID=A0A7C2UJQ1_9CREN|nr:MAG: amidohydrolase family protein [Fervidicoccus sp.]HEU97948.1 amidohydrolase family protein [Fervidicoccus fontis]